jgi:hypothetical protein
MSQPVAYWDSSALVPLCVEQSQTNRAGVLYESYEVVTWWATQVEMMSGLTRLERMGQISHDRFLAGKHLAEEIVRDWISAGASQSIAVDACLLLELYPLFAADALQLATALEACEHKPQGFVFVTADRRLAEAAGRCGFSVEFI